MPQSRRPGRGPRRKKKRGSSTGGALLPKKRPDEIRMDGVVTEVLPNSSCHVELVNGHTVLATMSGKMKRYRIRVLPGDKVTVQFTPYDLTRGQVVRREG